MEKNSRVYVAGHRGMVGSAICRKLKEFGYENIIVRSSSELDLRNKLEVEEFFLKEKPEFVFLAAATVGGIAANIKSPVEFLINNVEIQNNVIISSLKNKVKKLIFLGSSCIYSTTSRNPIKEENLLEGPFEPTNENYALAKIVGVKLLNSLKRQYNFDCISVIPCNLYGPNDSFDPENSHVLSALVRKFVDARDNSIDSVTIWGSGVARREFLHVDDAAEGIIFLSDFSDKFDIINLGTGTDISINELAVKIASHVGYNGQIHWDKTRPNGMLRKCMDVSKLDQLGYSPKINLDAGIIQMIDIYNKQKK